MSQYPSPAEAARPTQIGSMTSARDLEVVGVVALLLALVGATRIAIDLPWSSGTLLALGLNILAVGLAIAARRGMRKYQQLRGADGRAVVQASAYRSVIFAVFGLGLFVDAAMSPQAFPIAGEGIVAVLGLAMILVSVGIALVVLTPRAVRTRLEQGDA